MCETCVILAARNEELEAEVANLRSQVLGDIYGLGWEPPEEFGLTDAQTRLVAALLKHDRTVAHSLLFDATRTPKSYAESGVGNLVNVMVSHIRAKLKPFGLEIQTVWGRGYRLSPDSRQRLLNWPHPTSRAA